MTEQRKEELRKALIRATIHVIANDGLDKATTKALATCAQVNEGYIYRVFDGKYADGIVSDHSAVIVKMYK